MVSAGRPRPQLKNSLLMRHQDPEWRLSTYAAPVVSEDHNMAISRPAAEQQSQGHTSFHSALKEHESNGLGGEAVATCPPRLGEPSQEGDKACADDTGSQAKAAVACHVSSQAAMVEGPATEALPQACSTAAERIPATYGHEESACYASRPPVEDTLAPTHQAACAAAGIGLQPRPAISAPESGVQVSCCAQPQGAASSLHEVSQAQETRCTRSASCDSFLVGRGHVLLKCGSEAGRGVAGGLASEHVKTSEEQAAGQMDLAAGICDKPAGQAGAVPDQHASSATESRPAGQPAHAERAASAHPAEQLLLENSSHRGSACQQALPACSGVQQHSSGPSSDADSAADSGACVDVQQCDMALVPQEESLLLAARAPRGWLREHGSRLGLPSGSSAQQQGSVSAAVDDAGRPAAGPGQTGSGDSCVTAAHQEPAAQGAPAADAPEAAQPAAATQKWVPRELAMLQADGVCGPPRMPSIQPLSHPDSALLLLQFIRLLFAIFSVC